MSSNSLNTFLMMMENFLNELCETFPDDAKLKTHKMKFEMMKKTNPKKIFDLFMEHVSPVQEYIVNRNDEIFNLELETHIISDMKHVWFAETTSTNTKDAIWAHLNTMYMFGTTIKAIPSNLMQSIESLAQEYASEMEQSDNMMEGFDPSLMIQNMQHMMQSMPMTNKHNKKPMVNNK